MDTNTILKSLQTRYATKAFDKTKKIPQEQWSFIEEALRLTPSSYGLEPWKFIVITNDDLKAELKPHSFNQPSITDCSHLLVICANTNLNRDDVKRYFDQSASLGNMSKEDSVLHTDRVFGTFPYLGDLTAYTKNQAFIALGNILTVASLVGIDACPVGGFMPNEYDRILNLKSLNLTSTVVVPFGYRNESDEFIKYKKVRKAKEDLFIYKK
jgi:nitroreductase